MIAKSPRFKKYWTQEADTFIFLGKVTWTVTMLEVTQ